MPISIACPSCKTRFKVSDQAAGKIATCLKCQEKILVPALAPPPIQQTKETKVQTNKRQPNQTNADVAKTQDDGVIVSKRPVLTSPATPQPQAATIDSQDNMSGFFRDPFRFSLATLAVACLSIFLGVATLGIAILIFNLWVSIVVVLLDFGLAIVTIVSFSLFFQLLMAKGRAIEEGKKPTSKPIRLLFGFGDLLLWEQNQGMILLKNKRIHRVVYGPKVGGGLMILYPFIGEECKAKVTLTITLSHFEDSRIQTREAIQLFVKVAIWWRVIDLEKYYYVINKEIHYRSDQGKHSQEAGSTSPDRAQHEAAEEWIRTLVESCTRKLISDTSTAYIVSKKAATYLHNDSVTDGVDSNSQTTPASSNGHVAGPATPDMLAHELWNAVNPKAKDYGLEVERVEIQEIRLPADIQSAVDEVWIASTKPAKSEYEARAQQIALEKAVAVLGVDAVALKEVMKDMPSSSGLAGLGGIPNVLEALLLKTFAKGKKAPLALPAQPPPSLPPQP